MKAVSDEVLELLDGALGLLGEILFAGLGRQAVLQARLNRCPRLPSTCLSSYYSPEVLGMSRDPGSGAPRAARLGRQDSGRLAMARGITLRKAVPALAPSPLRL